MCLQIKCIIILRKMQTGECRSQKKEDFLRHGCSSLNIWNLYCADMWLCGSHDQRLLNQWMASVIIVRFVFAFLPAPQTGVEAIELRQKCSLIYVIKGKNIRVQTADCCESHIKDTPLFSLLLGVCQTPSVKVSATSAQSSLIYFLHSIQSHYSPVFTPPASWG